MSRSTLYVVLGAALVLAGLACFAGVAGLARLPRRARRVVTWGVLLAWGALLVARPDAWLLVLVLVAAAGIVAGAALGGTLASPGSLATFLLVVAAVDVVSFSGGPTAWIMEGYREGSSDLLLYLAVSFPLGGRMVPLIGIGDLLVLSAVWEAARRLGLPALPLAGVLTAALLLALGVGLAVGGVGFLPFAALTTVPWLILRRRRPAPRPPPPPARPAG